MANIRIFFIFSLLKAAILMDGTLATANAIVQKEDVTSTASQRPFLRRTLVDGLEKNETTDKVGGIPPANLEAILASLPDLPPSDNELLSANYHNNSDSNSTSTSNSTSNDHYNGNFVNLNTMFKKHAKKGKHGKHGHHHHHDGNHPSLDHNHTHFHDHNHTHGNGTSSNDGFVKIDSMARNSNQHPGMMHKNDNYGNVNKVFKTGKKNGKHGKHGHHHHHDGNHTSLDHNHTYFHDHNHTHGNGTYSNDGFVKIDSIARSSNQNPGMMHNTNNYGKKKGKGKHH
eukprot:scaffold257909_cov66-Attheya_sp.AAC.1